VDRRLVVAREQRAPVGEREPRRGGVAVDGDHAVATACESGAQGQARWPRADDDGVVRFEFLCFLWLFVAICRTARAANDRRPRRFEC
jgi:hypothetical protein